MAFSLQSPDSFSFSVHGLYITPYVTFFFCELALEEEEEEVEDDDYKQY